MKNYKKRISANIPGMANKGMRRGNAPKIETGDGGSVRGPGGPTNDRVGPVALANTEYVLPADTVKAMGGVKALDAIRAKTHTFVNQKNKPAIMRGMANGGVSGYTVEEMPIAEEINMGFPPADRAAIDSAVQRGQLPPGMAKNPAYTPALDSISDNMKASNAPKPPASRIGSFVKGGTALGMATGAAQSLNDIGNGYRNKFQQDMGVETPAGSVVADTARTLGNVGNALTFGLAGRVGQGISSAMNGGKFSDGFSQATDRNRFLAGQSQPSAAPGVGENIGAGARMAADGAGNVGVAIGQGARTIENARKGAMTIANNIPGAIAAPIATAADSFGADIRTGFTGQKYAGNKYAGTPLFDGSAQTATPASQSDIVAQLQAKNDAIINGDNRGKIDMSKISAGDLAFMQSRKAQAAAATSVSPVDTSPSAGKINAAESTLPANFRNADGTLNSRALFNSTPMANGDKLAAEQAVRAARGFNEVQGWAGQTRPLAGGGTVTNLGYDNPKEARAWHELQASKESSPESIAITNNFIRARNNTPQNIAADNARFASEGYGGVTKSLDNNGRVVYSNTGAPNPYLISKFSNGKTGQQLLDERLRNDAALVAEGTARNDKYNMERATRNAGYEKGAAEEAKLRLNQMKIAADLAPKPETAYDMERTRGAKADNDRAAITDGLLNDYLNAPDDKTRNAVAAKWRTLSGKNGAAADKYEGIEVDTGKVDTLTGAPITRKTKVNTRTKQTIEQEMEAAIWSRPANGGRAVTRDQIDVVAKTKGITDPAQLKELYAMYGIQ